LITTPEEVSSIKGRLKDVDGILAIHLTLGIMPILNEILSLGQPAMVFAVPYSGHEWANFGSLLNQPLGSKMECILSSDYQQLATAIRPFRAIHHLREAKILNLTTRSFTEYADNVKNKFGTEIKQIELKRLTDVYDDIDDTKAKDETNRWIKEAAQVVEPSKEDIFKSCKLALAFEKLLDEEDATVITADCYGSMFSPLCQSYAFPCLGFTRLNNMGLGGICESDLRSAITHVLFQGLVGRPGFISDPTVDELKNSIILAHCL
jgi:L-fucose isomerase-like protein